MFHFCLCILGGDDIFPQGQSSETTREKHTPRALGMEAETSATAVFLDLSRPHGATMNPRLQRQQLAMPGAMQERAMNDKDCSLQGRGVRSRRRRHSLPAFATLATILVVAVVSPVADAFLGPQNAGVAGLSVVSQRGKGLSVLPLKHRRLPAGKGATRWDRWSQQE